MTEYQDAAHAAYNRLKWCENNRPDPQKVAEAAKAERTQDWQRRQARFRQSIA